MASTMPDAPKSIWDKKPSEMSVSELRDALHRKRVRCSHCVERQELVDLLAAELANKPGKPNPPTPAPAAPKAKAAPRPAAAATSANGTAAQPQQGETWQWWIVGAIVAFWAFNAIRSNMAPAAGTGGGKSGGGGGDEIEGLTWAYEDYVDDYEKGLAADLPTFDSFKGALEHHRDVTGMPLVIDVYSTTCGPCRMIAPVFKAYAKQFAGQAAFIKINSGRNGQTAGALGVRSLPTFLYAMEGRTVTGFSGADAGRLIEMTTDFIEKAKAAHGGQLYTPDSKVTIEALLTFLAPRASQIPGGGDPQAEAERLAAAFSGKPAKLARLLVSQYGEAPDFKPPAPVSLPEGQELVRLLGGLGLSDLQAELSRRGVSLASPPSASGDDETEDEDEDEDDEEWPDLKPAWGEDRMTPEKVVVIGGGPAGLSAAIYAARAGLQPVVLAPAFGGQLMGKGVDVENYPGLMDQTGPSVVQLMQSQAVSFGTVFLEDLVDTVDLTTQPFTLRTKTTGQEVKTRAMIVATGADARWLGVEGEHRLRGGGVSTCATCDGFLFRDQDVVVVGGGDTAMEDALVLARTSASVTLVHRRDSFRASKALADRVLSNEKIQVLWNSTVVSFEGTQGDSEAEDPAMRPRLTRVVVKSTVTGQHEEVPCTGAFVAIGHDPNTQLFKGQLSMASNGYLNIFNQSTTTSVPGVFAAGDVADHVYRQAITSAGSGAMASLDAERWLSAQGYSD